MKIDLHTHILPGIDDGAADVKTSLAMLQMMAEQGVDTVVATPHYFSLDNTPDAFCARTEDAYDALMDAWQSSGNAQQLGTPNFLFGAEVYLDRNLQLVEGLERLCVSGTDLMLFELPFSAFRDWMPWTIRSVCSRLRVRPVIAHLERYLSFYSKSDLEQLLEIPSVMFQFNVSVLSNRAGVKMLLRLLKEEYMVFFGSDCHDARHRPPELGTRMPELQNLISRKISPDLFDAILYAQQQELNL